MQKTGRDLEILGEKAWRPPLFRRLRSFHVAEVRAEGNRTASGARMGPGRAMIAVAASSLFIHTIRTWNVWSPTHLLSMFTLPTVPLAVVYARRFALAGANHHAIVFGA